MAIVRNLEGYDPSQHEFFENLRNYRDAVGLSRNKLADKTGISAAIYSPQAILGMCICHPLLCHGTALEFNWVHTKKVGKLLQV
mgnify:CR=1 FL=1